MTNYPVAPETRGEDSPDLGKYKQKTYTPPPPPVYNKPNFYAPRQSQLQKATYDPASTSHDQLQRFGIPSHY